MLISDPTPPPQFWSYPFPPQQSLVHPGHPPLKAFLPLPGGQSSLVYSIRRRKEGVSHFSLVLQARLPIQRPKSSRHNMPGQPSSGIPCTFKKHQELQTQGMKGFQPLGSCLAVVPRNILQSFQSRALPAGAWWAKAGPASSSSAPPPAQPGVAALNKRAPYRSGESLTS